MLLGLATSMAWMRYPQQEDLSRRFYLISEQRNGVNDLADAYSIPGQNTSTDFLLSLKTWTEGHRQLRNIVVDRPEYAPIELMEVYDQSFLALETHFSNDQSSQNTTELALAYEAAGDRLALQTSESLNKMLSGYRTEMLILFASVLVLLLVLLRLFIRRNSEDDNVELSDSDGSNNATPFSFDLARSTANDFKYYQDEFEGPERVFHFEALHRLVHLALAEKKVRAAFLFSGLLADVRSFIALRYPQVTLQTDVLGLESTEVEGDVELIGRTLGFLTDRVLALSGARELRIQLNKVDASESGLHVRIDLHLHGCSVSKADLNARFESPLKGMALVESLMQMHRGSVWLDTSGAQPCVMTNFIFDSFTERVGSLGLSHLEGKRVFLVDGNATRLRERVKSLSEFGLMVTPFNSLTAFEGNSGLFARFDFGVVTIPNEESELYGFLASLHSRVENERRPVIALYPAGRQPKEEKVWAATLTDLCTNSELAEALVYVLHEQFNVAMAQHSEAQEKSVIPIKLNLN